MTMSNVEDKYARHKGKNPLSNEIAILKVVDALKVLIELSRLQSGSSERHAEFISASRLS